MQCRQVGRGVRELPPCMERARLETVFSIFQQRPGLRTAAFLTSARGRLPGPAAQTGEAAGLGKLHAGLRHAKLRSETCGAHPLPHGCIVYVAANHLREQLLDVIELHELVAAVAWRGGVRDT